jgi:hypothetical protein
MANIGPNRWPEFEPITKEERIARDPRGLTRVTIIGETVFVKKVTKSPEAAVLVEQSENQVSSVGDPIGLAEELTHIAHETKETGTSPRELGEE